MNIHDIAQSYAKANINKLIEMPTQIHRKDKYVRYDMPEKLAGIYFIYTADNNELAYIGETGRCIKSRIARHKRSMNNPEWSGERSGKKFHTANLQDKTFIVKYILAKDLELVTKHDRLSSESLFVTALKPIVYGD